MHVGNCLEWIATHSSPPSQSLRVGAVQGVDSPWSAAAMLPEGGREGWSTVRSVAAGLPELLAVLHIRDQHSAHHGVLSRDTERSSQYCSVCSPCLGQEACFWESLAECVSGWAAGGLIAACWRGGPEPIPVPQFRREWETGGRPSPRSWGFQP